MEYKIIEYVLLFAFIKHHAKTLQKQIIL